MRTDIAAVHIQDLVDVLESVYTRAEIIDAIRRFESGDPVGVEDRRPVEGLEHAVESGTFREILAYLLDGVSDEGVDRAALEEALAGTPLSVREGPDGLELYQRITGVADRSIRSARDYLEANAPGAVLRQIEEAERLFGEGDYDLAVAEMTRAFDALVVSGYTDGLEELVEHDLIMVGGEHEYTDANVLYVVYGYCSMLGGDPARKPFNTSKTQAELGLVSAQQVLYFLITTLERAIADGIELSHWDYP